MQPQLFVFDMILYMRMPFYICMYKQHRWCSIKLGWACSVIVTRGLLQQAHGSQPTLKHKSQPPSQTITGSCPAVVKTAGKRRVVARYSARSRQVAASHKPRLALRASSTITIELESQDGIQYSSSQPCTIIGAFSAGSAPTQL